MSIWDKHNLEKDVCYKIKLGPLSVWIKNVEDEIQIASQRVNEDTIKPGEQPQLLIVDDARQTAGLAWGRWIAGDNCNRIRILPVMPNRSIVVRPELPLKLPAGQKAMFYVRIPAWIRVAIVSVEDVVLREEPTVELSNIWFGDPVSGELCYSLRSRARRKFADFVPMAHRVICPIFISNLSKTELNVERFCIQANHLNIYAGTNMMWTNDIKIQFHGDELESSIDYTQKPSELEPDAVLITHARTPFKKALFQRGLDSIKLFGNM